MSHDSHSLDSSHKWSRTLSSLLTTVTTVSNEGQLILGIPSDQGCIYNSLLDNPTGQTREVLLSALAALLVRDTEAVALPPHRAEGVSGIAVAKEEQATKDGFLCFEEGSENWIFVSEKPDTLQWITAISNSDTKDPKPELEGDISEHLVTLIKDGESYWKKLSADDPWFYIYIKCHHPLKNHVMTLSDFFQSYRVSDTQDQRNQLFQTVTHYLIASCWRKMRQRARHWSSLGYLYMLHDVTPRELSFAYHRYHKDLDVPQYNKFDRDRLLASIFVETTQETIDKILKNCPWVDDNTSESVLPSPGGLLKLREAFQRVIDDKKAAYTPDTIIEFHRLLISTIFGYTHALQRLFNLKRMKDTNDEALRKAGCSVWTYACLLWYITRSHMLQYHLAILQNGNLLARPESSRSPRYIHRYEKILSDSVCSGTEGANGDANVDSCVDETEDNEDKPDDGLDISLLGVGVNQEQLATVFLRWLRLQVGHFVALHTLSIFCGRRPDPDAHVAYVYLL